MQNSHWFKQLQEFSHFIDSHPCSDYRDWQPTKWQSLLRVSNDLVSRCGFTNNSIVDTNRTVLELGCGSATMLLQFALLGLQCIGVDKSTSALELARQAAMSLDTAKMPNFQNFDLLEESASRYTKQADLVFSIGVIEHFDKTDQALLLDIHRQLSQRWIMIGVPQLDSPVFKSFIEWAENANQLYPEEHYSCSIPDLATDANLNIVLTDGCHLFLGKSEYYIPGCAELDKFYRDIRTLLLELGGKRYSAFPHMDFTFEDIGILSQVEGLVSQEERVHFGFLNYYLLEKDS